MRVSHCNTFLLSAVLIFGSVAPTAHAQAVAAGMTSNSSDPKVQNDIVKALKDKRFRGITVTVQDNEITLGGTVALAADKIKAELIARNQKNVSLLHNEIQVEGDSVSDVELRNKLSEKLAADRIGYGTTAFNSITISVSNGGVTLGGTVYGPDDKASAMDLVSHYPGVRGVVDHIEVAPVSPFDDQIRVAVARAIYGFPSMQKYAVVPEKPIRIVVVNGKVTLYGVVDNQADKDTANIRAQGVANVFQVTNNLQVAGSHSEK